MDRIIHTEDFAELARSTPATVRYWVHTGYAPPSAKLGRRRVWRESDVLAWIDQRFEQASGQLKADGVSGDAA